jgi:hypothetical protein
MRILSHDLKISDDMRTSLCAHTARVGEIKLVLIVNKGENFTRNSIRRIYSKSYKWDGTNKDLRNNIRKFVYRTPDTDDLVILEALSGLSDMY